MDQPPLGEPHRGMLWRHLSASGHDACTVVDAGRGWHIKGASAFESDRGIAHLTYDVQCDAGWQTLRATVEGTVGGREVSHHIRRMSNGTWMLDHVVQPQLANCADLDLAFTPATNTIAIRRLDLDMGASAIVQSAWLDVVGEEFSVLEQQYERISNHQYRYRSPRFAFEATIRVNDFGLVVDYPDLFTQAA